MEACCKNSKRKTPHLDLMGSRSIMGSRKRKLKAMWHAVSNSGKENHDSAHLFVRFSTELRVR